MLKHPPALSPLTDAAIASPKAVVLPPSAQRLGPMAVFALAVFLVVPAAARGQTQVIYVPSTTVESGKPLRWMYTNCAVLRANSAGSANITDGSDLRAIESAVQRWHRATENCSYFRLDLQEPLPDAKPEYNSRGFNENVIYWVESNWPHDPQAAGLTVLFYVDDQDSDQDGRLLDADIELNGRFAYTATGGDDSTDIENTIVHELGHLMGLDHTCHDGARNPRPRNNLGELIPLCVPRRLLPTEATEATMYNFSDPGETKKRTPEAGDILGVCETYPLEEDPGVCRPVDLADGGCDTVTTAPFAFGSWPAVALALCALLLALPLWRRLRRRGRRTLT